MWSKTLGFVAILAGAGVSGSACAMSAPPHQGHGHCRVIGGEKLPASVGGTAGICTAVEKAVQSRAPKVRYSAEIQVLTKSALAADIVAAGRKLPKQNFAVMDRNLTASSIERFADAVAREIAKAAKS